jgi:hypothetical protein
LSLALFILRKEENMMKILIVLLILLALLALPVSSAHAYPERMPLPPQIVFCAIPRTGAALFSTCDNLNWYQVRAQSISIAM